MVDPFIIVFGGIAILRADALDNETIYSTSLFV